MHLFFKKLIEQQSKTNHFFTKPEPNEPNHKTVLDLSGQITEQCKTIVGAINQKNANLYCALQK